MSLDSEIVLPEKRLWTFAETAWPYMRNTRPMRAGVVLKDSIELVLELFDEDRGAGSARDRRLTDAHFAIIDGGNEARIRVSSFVINLQSQTIDPFLEYYADRFEESRLLENIAS